MDKIKPLSPQEVAARKASDLPTFVVTAVNELLVSTPYFGGTGGGQLICLKQVDIIAKINELSSSKARGHGREYSDAEMIDLGWLDFEGAFEACGWIVRYVRTQDVQKTFFEFTHKR